MFFFSSVDEIPESERVCCQRTTKDEEKCGTNFRWKRRSSSSFRPSERTSKLIESVSQKLDNAKASTIKLHRYVLNPNVLTLLDIHISHHLAHGTF